MASLQEIMALASGVHGTKAEDYDIRKSSLVFAPEKTIPLTSIVGYYTGKNVRDELAHIRDVFPKATVVDLINTPVNGDEEVSPIHAAFLSDPECNTLVQSVREHGVQTRILVTPVKSSKTKFEVISGSRRLGSASVAGLKEIKAQIVTGSHEDIVDLMIRENTERKDGSDLDMGRFFVAQHGHVEPGKGKGMSIEELARRYGKGSGKTGPVQYVTRRMRLVEIEKRLGTHLSEELANVSATKRMEKSQNLIRDARKLVDDQVTTWEELKSPVENSDGKKVKPDLGTLIRRVADLKKPAKSGPSPMFDYSGLRDIATSEDPREAEPIAKRLIAKFGYDCEIGQLSIQVLDTLRAVFGMKATAPKTDETKTEEK